MAAAATVEAPPMVRRKLRRSIALSVFSDIRSSMRTDPSIRSGRWAARPCPLILSGRARSRVHCKGFRLDLHEQAADGAGRLVEAPVLRGLAIGEEPRRPGLEMPFEERSIRTGLGAESPGGE